MLQPGAIHAINNLRYVIERSRSDLMVEDAALADVQAARARPDDGCAGLDGDLFIALLVEVGE